MRVGLVHAARVRRGSWWRSSLITGALITAACASAPFQAPVPSNDRTAVIHLLNRATYGARVEDVDAVLRMGIDDWLDRQLEPPRAVAQAAPKTEAQPPADAGGTMVTMRPGGSQLLVRLNTTQAIGTLVHEKLARAVSSERQLEEVMTDFWFNHFNVFYNKAQVRLTVADYVQNAIQRHVFGRFEDMLLATAQHPSMLVYLDNFVSTVAPAVQPAGPRRPQRGGLNENYARELLELHTLGVDGGYTQQDVIEVARALTGWGIGERRTPVKNPPASAPNAFTIAGFNFQFNEDRHDRGEKVVLGQTLPAGRGIEDGIDVIRMLARHPSTAKHIATKLVRHFVADDPPRELVDELAEVFRRTDGDLRAVTRALFTSKRFYDPAYYRAKTRRPFEFVASALRVTGGSVQQSQALTQQLRTFGHLPYSEPAPTGYPTVAAEWLSAGAMMNRMRFAIDLVGGRVTGVQFPAGSLLGAAQRANGPQRVRNNEAANVNGSADAAAANALTAELLQQLLPGVPAERLSSLIATDLAAQPASDRRTVATRVAALILGSPEFQRY